MARARIRGKALAGAAALAAALLALPSASAAPSGAVPYVAGWVDDLDILRHHMSAVVTASQWILGDLEKQSPASRNPSLSGAPLPELHRDGGVTRDRAIRELA